MIAEECFTEKWLQDIRRRYPLASPQILEKTLYAFEFLGLLARSGQPFVFKGGTALILILPELKRLSIDVDIVGNISLDVFGKVIQGSRFTHMEEDIRKGEVPAMHVKFFYNSLLRPSVNYVLVDMLKDNHPYTKLQKAILERSELFMVREKLSVSIPSPDDILGDKLTAFAPNSTGVLYGSDKSLEIIKQLYDVGELVRHVSSVDTILSTFERVCGQQNKYRKTTFTTDEVIEDVIATSRLICHIDFKGHAETTNTAELRAGMKSIQSFLVAARFSLPEAKLAASRAAFVATLLKKRLTGEKLNRYQFTSEKIEQFRNEQLTGDLVDLNKLKRTNPEAFYYWWLISKLG